MLRQLVQSFLRYESESDGSSCRAMDALIKDIERDAIAAFELAQPLVDRYPHVYHQSNCFIDFLFKICNTNLPTVSQPMITNEKEHLECQIQTMSQEIKQLTEKLDHCTSNIKAYEELKCSNQILLDKVSNLSQQLQESDSKSPPMDISQDKHWETLIESFKSQLSQCQQENDNLLKRQRDYDLKAYEPCHNCKTLKSQLSQCQQENHDLLNKQRDYDFKAHEPCHNCRTLLVEKEELEVKYKNCELEKMKWFGKYKDYLTNYKKLQDKFFSTSLSTQKDSEENQLLVKENRKLLAELEECRNQLFGKIQTNTDLEMELADFNEDRKPQIKIENTVKDLENQIDQLRESLKQCKDNLKKCQEEKREQEDKMDDDQFREHEITEDQNFSWDYMDLKTENNIQDLGEQIDQLQKSLSQCKDDLKKCQKEKRALERKMEKDQLEKSRVHELDLKIENTVEDLGKQIDQLQESLSQCKDDLEKCQREKRVLEEKMVEQDDRLQKCRLNLNTTKEKNGTLQTEIYDLNSKLQICQLDKESLNAAQIQLEAANKQLAHERDKYKGNVNKLNEKLIAEQRCGIENVKETQTTHDKAIQYLKSQHALETNKIQQKYEYEVERMKSKNSDLSHELSFLKKQSVMPKMDPFDEIPLQTFSPDNLFDGIGIYPMDALDSYGSSSIDETKFNINVFKSEESVPTNDWVERVMQQLMNGSLAQWKSILYRLVLEKVRIYFNVIQASLNYILTIPTLDEESMKRQIGNCVNRIIQYNTLFPSLPQFQEQFNAFLEKFFTTKLNEILNYNFLDMKLHLKQLVENNQTQITDFINSSYTHVKNQFPELEELTRKDLLNVLAQETSPTPSEETHSQLKYYENENKIQKETLDNLDKQLEVFKVSNASIEKRLNEAKESNIQKDAVIEKFNQIWNIYFPNIANEDSFFKSLNASIGQYQQMKSHLDQEFNLLQSNIKINSSWNQPFAKDIIQQINDAENENVRLTDQNDLLKAEKQKYRTKMMIIRDMFEIDMKMDEFITIADEKVKKLFIQFNDVNEKFRNLHELVKGMKHVDTDDDVYIFLSQCIEDFKRYEHYKNSITETYFLEQKEINLIKFFGLVTTRFDEYITLQNHLQREFEKLKVIDFYDWTQEFSTQILQYVERLKTSKPENKLEKVKETRTAKQMREKMKRLQEKISKLEKESPDDDKDLLHQEIKTLEYEKSKLTECIEITRQQRDEAISKFGRAQDQLTDLERSERLSRTVKSKRKDHTDEINDKEEELRDANRLKEGEVNALHKIISNLKKENEKLTQTLQENLQVNRDMPNVDLLQEDERITLNVMKTYFYQLFLFYFHLWKSVQTADISSKAKKLLDDIENAEFALADEPSKILLEFYVFQLSGIAQLERPSSTQLESPSIYLKGIIEDTMQHLASIK